MASGSGRKEYEMLINLVAKYTGDRALSKAQKDIAGIGNAITRLSRTQKQVRTLSALEEKLNRLAQSGETTGKEFKTASRQAEKLRDVLLGAGVNTGFLRTEEIKLEKEIVDLQNKQDDLVKAFHEYDVAAKEETEQNKKLQESLDAIVSSQAFNYIKEGVGKVVDAFKACVSAEMEFESTMSKVQALSGASGNELEQLSQAAKDMGASTVYTAEESANALSLMALAGWDTTEMLNGLQPILNLAASSEMDMSEATSAVTDNLTAFGMSTEETGRMVDVMAYAMANSNTTTSQLKEAYKGVAATSNTLGVSLEETTALLMVMANQGAKSSTAGVALNAIFTRLATNTSKCADVLKNDYNISVYDSNHQMRSMSDILNELGSAWRTMSDEEQATVGKLVAGQRQFNKLQMILKGFSKDAEDSGRSYNDFLSALQNSSGSAEQMAETMLDNLKGEVTLLSSAFDGLKIAVGESLSEELSGLAEWLTKVTSGLRDWIKKNPGAVKVVSALTIAVGGLTLALTAVTVAQKIFNATLAGIPGLKPLLLIASAIGAIVGLAMKWKSEYEEIVPSVSSLTKEARELNSALKEQKEDFENSQAEALASSNLIEDYAGKLRSLETEQRDISVRGGDATEVNKRWHETLEELCYVVPELSSLIDLETDSIKGGIDALERHAEATKEDAMAQAYAKYYESVYKEYGDVLAESAKNNVKLNMAKKEESELIEEQNWLIDRQNELRDDAKKKAEEFNRVNGDNSSWENFTTSEYDEIDQKLADVGIRLSDNRTKQENLNVAISDGEAAAAEANTVLKAAKDAMDEYGKSAENGAEAVDKLAGFTIQYSEAQGEMLDNAFTSIVTEEIDAIQTLCETYEEAYTSALESVHGQMNIWDESRETTATSVDNMKSYIEAQTKYWAEYNANLGSLSKLYDTIPGLQEMINSFADGSEESVNAVAGLADALSSNGEQSVKDMVSAWQELQTEQDNVASSIAETTGVTEEEVSKMVDELGQDIQNMNYSYEAASAAASTFEAYATTADSWLSNIALNVAAKVQEIAGMLNSAGTMTVTTTPDASLDTSEAEQNAVGTLSASTGYHIVGENGPELMYLSGGQKIITAAQTRALVQHAYDPNVMAQEGMSSEYSISVAPVYNITGSNADSVRNVLEENNNSLKSFIVQTIKEAQKDSRRRAYA